MKYQSRFIALLKAVATCPVTLFFSDLLKLVFINDALALTTANAGD